MNNKIIIRINNTIRDNEFTSNVHMVTKNNANCIYICRVNGEECKFGWIKMWKQESRFSFDFLSILFGFTNTANISLSIAKFHKVTYSPYSPIECLKHAVFIQCSPEPINILFFRYQFEKRCSPLHLNDGHNIRMYEWNNNSKKKSHPFSDFHSFQF